MSPRTLGLTLALAVLGGILLALGREPAAQPEPPGWSMPIPVMGYNAREGRALFRHYCLTCHGEEGHGDGLNAYNLDPKPRDLADPDFLARRTDEELTAIIRSGGGVAGLSTGMPPWGRTLSEREILNLVAYLRALPQPTQEPASPNE